MAGGTQLKVAARRRKIATVPVETADLPVAVNGSELRDLCRRYHVCRLSFFGSVLRPDFGPTSDVDVLVEFHPGRMPGLAFLALQHDLSQLLGRTVDLNTADDLPPAFRADVCRAARVQFEAA